MNTKVTDIDLEGYLSDSLSPAKKKQIEESIRRSPELQARMEELREEQMTLDAVKDSFAIRLPDAEEQRIVSKVSDRIKTSLPPDLDNRRGH